MYKPNIHMKIFILIVVKLALLKWLILFITFPLCTDHSLATDLNMQCMAKKLKIVVIYEYIADLFNNKMFWHSIKCKSCVIALNCSSSFTLLWAFITANYCNRFLLFIITFSHCNDHKFWEFRSSSVTIHACQIFFLYRTFCIFLSLICLSAVIIQI